MKVVAIYRKPTDPKAFDKAYFETHIPLIEKVPGILKTTVTRITRTLVGEGDIYMIAEMTFADKDSLKAGMRSPEMIAAGENLDSFAAELYTLTFAEDVL